MSFTGQFTFTNAVEANTVISLNPRENDDFKKACSFASRVELVSAVGEFLCLANGETTGRISAGFIHADVTESDLAVRTSPDAVIMAASRDAPMERSIPFTSNRFFGNELKGAVLGHQPPKFVVYPVSSPGKVGDGSGREKVLIARLTIVVRLLGDGSSGVQSSR